MFPLFESSVNIDEFRAKDVNEGASVSIALSINIRARFLLDSDLCWRMTVGNNKIFPTLYLDILMQY